MPVSLLFKTIVFVPVLTYNYTVPSIMFCHIHCLVSACNQRFQVSGALVLACNPNAYGHYDFPIKDLYGGF